MRAMAFAAVLLACATTPSWWSRPNPEADERVAALAALEAARPKTIHEYCVMHAEHYAGYEECYAERPAAEERWVRAIGALAEIGSTAR